MISAFVDVNLWIKHLIFQAQKRKLGLLEDDDISKQCEIEDKGSDAITGFGKNRGMLWTYLWKCLILLKIINIKIPDNSTKSHAS